MKFYHGTNKDFVLQLLNLKDKIDVKRGRGELGQGFYTAKEPGLVAVWSRDKYKSNQAVIEFEISESLYVQLNIHLVKTRKEVLKIYKTDQRKIFNVDVVQGPMMSIDSILQYKFESSKSEDILNSSISDLFQF